MILGNNGNNQEFYDLCEQAIELLNEKKQLQLMLKGCWLFPHSYGSSFHIIYHDKSINADFQLYRNDPVLQKSTIDIDRVAGLEKVDDIKLKIALRIAYLIYRAVIKYNKQRDVSMGQQLGRRLEMATWTNQELEDFCEQAIELLNKKKQLRLKLKSC